MPNKPQSGFALIEALVSIVVVALGILGILGVQMRTMVDTQTGVRRAQAIRLIEDLSERTKVNPSALENINSYVVGWGAAPTPADCKATACDGAALAASDIQKWKLLIRGNPLTSIPPLLPQGDATTFLVADEAGPTNRRQLRVMGRWAENEREGTSAAENTAYKSVFVPDATGTAISCPAGFTCHLQYIQLTSRCSRYVLSGTPSFYCPY